MPEYPLDSITAAAYFLTFDALPFPGGTFDQPYQLIREMSYVVGVYREEQARAAD
jgi:hypothetical protein